MTRDQAQKRLTELKISEECYVEMLINYCVAPHILKALICIALGEESKKILQDQFPREERIKILMEIDNIESGWNLATIMCLMRELF
jgi:hypothetical protein